MKKTVPFKLFGTNDDYLTLNIKDLLTIETITGLSIIDIFRSYIKGAYTITSVYQIMPIAYASCAKEKGETASVEQLINTAFENGVAVTDFGIPMAHAIIATGIFGKKQETAKRGRAKPKDE